MTCKSRSGFEAKGFRCTVLTILQLPILDGGSGSKDAPRHIFQHESRWDDKSSLSLNRISIRQSSQQLLRGDSFVF